MLINYDGTDDYNTSILKTAKIYFKKIDQVIKLI
jgi:hypothetical protein